MAAGCVLAVLALAPLLMFHTSTASSDAQSQPPPPSKAPHTFARSFSPSSQEKLAALDAAALHVPPAVIHPATPAPLGAPPLPVHPPATANALAERELLRRAEELAKLGGGAQAPAADPAGVVLLAPPPAEPELAPLPAAGVPELEPPTASKPVPAPAPAPEIPAVGIAHSGHSEGDSTHGHPPPSDRGDKPADPGALEHGAGKDADAPRSGGEKATGTALNLRTTTSQKCEAVPRRARI